MIEPVDYKRNAELLLQLVRDHGAKGLGAIHWFFSTEHWWRCPCCFRSKDEIARLDKNDNLMCSFHEHHDHYCDAIGRVVKVIPEAEGLPRAMYDGLVRFPMVLICNDCNVAEPWAKNIVGAPPEFSFAPYEISSFIIVARNKAHDVDPERAQAAYALAVPAMGAISARLRAIQSSIRKDGIEGFEPLIDPVSRVINLTRERMKKS